MPSVFLSYSREDLSIVEQIEARIRPSSDILIWRDQKNIYGGQKWPRVLGEAISDQDVFLLAWSKNAAASHFVELEWCTAIALKKTIVPCLLDNTPLPPSLKALHALQVSDVAGLLTALRAAPLADRGRREPVIRRLDSVAVGGKEEVLQQVKAIFARQQWTVQGNIYQAGGDIHIYPGPPGQNVSAREKLLAEKWQLWVGILVAILTAITLAVELPNKFRASEEQFRPNDASQVQNQDAPSSQSLAGSIRDEGNDPLWNVEVSLPQLNLTKTTDQLGRFQFEVVASYQKTVEFLAQKPGYQPYETAVTLGNTSLAFTMKKRK